MLEFLIRRLKPPNQKIRMAFQTSEKARINTAAGGIVTSVVETNHLSYIGWFGFNGALRQYFSLYQVIFQREGESKEK